MKFNQYIKESFVGGMQVKESVTDARLLRKSIQDELEAINNYVKRAYEADNDAVKNLLLDIAKEEKVHFGELEELLEAVDMEHNRAEGEGEDEVNSGDALDSIRFDENCSKIKLALQTEKRSSNVLFEADSNNKKNINKMLKAMKKDLDFVGDVSGDINVSLDIKVTYTKGLSGQGSIKERNKDQQQLSDWLLKNAKKYNFNFYKSNNDIGVTIDGFATTLYPVDKETI